MLKRIAAKLRVSATQPHISGALSAFSVDVCIPMLFPNENTPEERGLPIWAKDYLFQFLRLDAY